MSRRDRRQAVRESPTRPSNGCGERAEPPGGAPAVARISPRTAGATSGSSVLHKRGGCERYADDNENEAGGVNLRSSASPLSRAVAACAAATLHVHALQRRLRRMVAPQLIDQRSRETIRFAFTSSSASRARCLAHPSGRSPPNLQRPKDAVPHSHLPSCKRACSGLQWLSNARAKPRATDRPRRSRNRNEALDGTPRSGAQRPPRAPSALRRRICRIATVLLSHPPSIGKSVARGGRRTRGGLRCPARLLRPKVS